MGRLASMRPLGGLRRGIRHSFVAAAAGVGVETATQCRRAFGVFKSRPRQIEPNGRADGASAASWFDWRLLGRWIAISFAAYAVIIVGGIALEEIASGVTTNLASNYRILAVIIIALIGSGIHGLVLGRWQWGVLRQRLPSLPRRKWVVATFVPALLVWALVIGPQALDILVEGGDTLPALKDAFIQALVLGPLIGLSQATALRDYTTRWRWWFVANITTYLSGAVFYQLGGWLTDVLSVPENITPAFPALAFAYHGVWMLWVSDPAVARDSSVLTIVESEAVRSRVA